MARIRTIKPEFFKHEDLFDAEVESGLPLRLAFVGLWTASDREGRFEWKPRALKSDILPFDDVDFSRVLDALTTRGFIEKYTVDGRVYGWIPSFTRHQVINNRERPSDLPEKPQHADLEQQSTRQPRVNHASPAPLRNAQAEGEGEQGREGERNIGGGGSARAQAHACEAEPADIAPPFTPSTGSLSHRERILEAIGVDPSGVTGPNGRLLGSQADMAEVQHWRDMGLTEDQQIAVIREMMATKRDLGPPASLKYFTGGMTRLSLALTAPAERAAPPQSDIRAMVEASTRALAAKGL